MHPWHPNLGHLLVLRLVLATLPENAQQPSAFEPLCAAENDEKTIDTIIYFDMWPFSNPLLIICSPVFAVEACQTLDLLKPPILHAFFQSSGWR
jgi:hypothetical protein